MFYHRTVSLYDHIATRLTGLVLTLPPVTFRLIVSVTSK